MSQSFNDTTNRMLNEVTPIYANDGYSLGIFDANGNAMDGIAKFAKSLTIELFPQNASWSLKYWEDLLGIVYKEKKSDSERSQKVLYELNKYFTITRNRLENVVNNFVEHRNAQVIDIPNSYEFIIEIPYLSRFFGRGLAEAIEEIKPAHLQYAINIIVKIDKLVLKIRNYEFNVGYPICNLFQTDTLPGKLAKTTIQGSLRQYEFDTYFPICNTFVTSTLNSVESQLNVELTNEYRDIDVLYPRASQQTVVGEGEI